MKKIKKFKNFLESNGYINKVVIKNGEITVGGSLDLEGTNITELPDNLTVGGYLDLRGTNITGQYELAKVKQLHIGYNKKLKYIYFDGILWGNVKSEKKRENITIYKTPLGYCTVENDLSAHGKTLKEALEDLQFKKIKSEEVQAIVVEIRKTKKVNKAQYRAITGACQYGTNKFCEEHNITADEIELSELKKILINDYGAEKFWNLIEEEK